MIFYLGTDNAAWLKRTGTPLFISHRTLSRCKTYPRAVGRWALDSGAFTSVSSIGGFTETAKEYALRVRIYAGEIGNLQWAAPQDWMCEPFILAKTGLDLREHQRRTVTNFCRLQQIEPGRFIPVLQGWTLDDYLRCMELYDAEDVILDREPLVGLGSICRRQNTTEAEQIITRLHAEGLRLHAFGFKRTGLGRVAHILESADSMAWKNDMRSSGRPNSHPVGDGMTRMDYALLWREKTMRAICAPKQWAMVMS